MACHLTQILGLKLDELLGSVSAAEIARVFEKGEWQDGNPIRVAVQTNGHEQSVNAILHRHDGLDFVELEALEPTPPQSPLAQQWIQGILLRIQNCTKIQDLWDTVAADVQRITGFNRIMIYKFDRDHHGCVIAERKQPDQPSFLGLHYPASDIPEQARRLYKLNSIRCIPNALYKPVPLIPIVDEEHSGLTDLTYSVLRSVSPVHCEYLQNMGVGASMSISIMRGNRLWGLIACHHSAPKYLRYDLRAACEVIGQVLSIRIAALEENEDSVYRSKPAQGSRSFSPSSRPIAIFRLR